MRKMLAHGFAALMVGTSCAWAQEPSLALPDAAAPPPLAAPQPPPPIPKQEAAIQPAPAAPTTTAAAPAQPAPVPVQTIPSGSGVTMQPWNPKVVDSNKSPYGEPPLDACDRCCLFLADMGLTEFWLQSEYLLWTLKDATPPPLLTTGPLTSFGIPGQPGTTVLFGGPTAQQDSFNGGRFTAGVWLDEHRSWGLEGSYQFLAERSLSTNVESIGTPLVARPFLDVTTGQFNSEVVAAPGFGTGGVAISMPTRYQGAEASAIFRYLTGPQYNIELLVGFRYLELTDGVIIQEDMAVAPTFPVLGGDVISRRDEFNTRNRLYAAQVGVRGLFHWNCWSVRGTFKLAMGCNSELIDIHGSTQDTVPGAVMPQLFPGGLLAVNTNSGRFHQDQFGVVPELGIDLGYNLGSHFRIFGGYTFQYWNSVVRAQNQIDLGVDPANIPFGPIAGPVQAARPQFRDVESSFWAQGLHAGLEFRY